MSKQMKFAPRRVCVACGTDAPASLKPTHLGPVYPRVSILSLNVVVYRRTAASGTQLASAKKVRVCERCLIRIAAEGNTLTSRGRDLADALLTSIAVKYRELAAQDRQQKGTT